MKIAIIATVLAMASVRIEAVNNWTGLFIDSNVNCNYYTINLVFHKYGNGFVDSVLDNISELFPCPIGGRFEVDFKGNSSEEDLLLDLKSKLKILRHEKSLGIFFLQNIILEDPGLQDFFNRILRVIYYKRNYRILLALEGIPFGGSQELEKIFKNGWIYHFINISIILIKEICTKSLFSSDCIYDLESWTFNPLGDNFLVRKVNISTLFPIKLHNLKHHKVRVYFTEEMPRVMMYNKGQIGGVDGKVVLTILQQLNGTPILVNLNRSIQATNPVYLDGLIMNKSLNVDIIMNRYPVGFGDSSFLQPIKMEYWCILVPRAANRPLYTNLILPFGPWVWFLTALVTILATIVYNYLRKFTTGQDDIGFAFTEMWRFMLFLPISSHFRVFNLHEKLFSMACMVLGFFLTFWYSTLLISFLTKPVPQFQLDTLKDIGESGIKIMASIEEYQKLINNSEVRRLLPKSFFAHITPLNWPQFYSTRNSFNKSYAYLTPSDKGRFLLLEGTVTEHPTYHLSKECILPLVTSYHVNKNSIFTERFNLMLLKIFDSGLLKKWFDDSFKESFHAGYFHMTSTQTPANLDDETKDIEQIHHHVHEEIRIILTMEHLLLAFYILFACQAVALIVFVFEVIINKKN